MRSRRLARRALRGYGYPRYRRGFGLPTTIATAGGIVLAFLTIRGSWRLAARTTRLGIRHRRRLAPVHAAVLLAVLGSICAAMADGWKTALFLDAALAASVAWWQRRRTAKGRTLRPIEAAYAYAAAATWGTLLLTIAAYGSLAAPMPGVLVLWLLAAGVPWWWHHRIRASDAQTGGELETWNTRVAHDKGALPGSQLAGFAYRDDGNGWKAAIALRPGEQTTSQAVAATEKIASAYRVSVASVVIEPPQHGGQDEAAISVFTVNPLQTVQPWAGPHLLDASGELAPIGAYPDGTDVRYRFWRTGSGPVHDLIAGTTDAGKSRLLDLLLGYERHCPLIVSWVCDPQRGQSLPDWQDAVDYFADSDTEGIKMLAAVKRVMLHRNKILARREWTDDQGRTRRGIGYFTPSPDMPLLSVTIDEAHAVLKNRDAVKLCEDIGKMARKCGIKLRLVTQVPLLAELGNSMTLRAMVASGNVIVLRTAERLSGQVAFNGAIDADPHALPREWPDGTSTAGLGYALGPGVRSSVMRTLLPGDAYDYATTGQLTTVEPDAATAADKDYATWRQRRDDALNTDPDAETETSSPAAVSLDKDPADLEPVIPGDGTAKDAVHAYLTNHETARTGVIAHDLDLPLPTVSQSLRYLAAEGRAQRVRHGVWAASEATRELAEALAAEHDEEAA